VAKLTDEQLRALLFLARHSNGCTEAALMAHGFPSQMLEELVSAGFAKVSTEEMKIARKRRKVLCFQITDAGRKAAADN
jgi:DNA-binding PadR family transcriptional regulator